MLTNHEISLILEDIALLSQIRGDSKFRTRAYENAAQAVDNLPQPLHEYEDLTKIKGIGKGIATEIKAILETSTSEKLIELKNELGNNLLDLTKVNGLGPKRIKLLFDELNVRSLEDLKSALENDSIQQLPGFGPKLRANIAKELERIDKIQGLTPLPVARPIAQQFVQRLQQRNDVVQVQFAGSLRRGKELIGDIDILVGTDDDSTPIFDEFLTFPEIMDTLAHGDTKCSVLLHNGIQVDVRVVPNNVFGAALHYFTGSKAHNVAIRTLAKKYHLKVSEYGVFKEDSETPIVSKTEHDLFHALSLAYIPPELREDQGEIEIAERAFAQNISDPFKLLELSQVQGDLHMHTVATDGANSILEMAMQAKALGLSYIAITDHSQAVTVANGLTPDRFAQHIENIREVNDSIDGIEVLAGIEVDILKDGTLDMDHDLLRSCDWVVGSIHSSFAMSEKAMTQRLVDALSTGLLSTLGHPTGRILGGRDGYTFDFEEVVAAANDVGCAFEVNGSFGRLDLDARAARRVVELGGRLSLGSDAHSIDGIAAVSNAVQQVRRAGLGADVVVNTFTWDKLRQALRTSL